MGILATSKKMFEKFEPTTPPGSSSKKRMAPWRQSLSKKNTQEELRELSNDELIDSLLSLLDKPVIVDPRFPQERRHRHDDDRRRSCPGLPQETRHRDYGRTRSLSMVEEEYDEIREEMVDSLLSFMEDKPTVNNKNIMTRTPGARAA